MTLPLFRKKADTEHPPALTREELTEVLAISLRAGQIMLENGANTSRVEETIERLGKSLGAERLDVYATPSGIITTAHSGGDHRTQVLRNSRTAIDLNRMAAVLDVSRSTAAGKLSRAETLEALDRIAVQKRVYGHTLTLAAVALACGFFALLFGGGIPEVLVAGCGAIIGHTARILLQPRRVSAVVIAFTIAAAASGIALVLSALFTIPQPAVAMLAAVLPALPGPLMVSSVSDLFRGDTVAGMSRGAGALLIIAAIGAGIWTILLISGTTIMPAFGTLPALPWSILPAAVAAVGISVLFDVPKRALIYCGLTGGLAYGSYHALTALNIPEIAAIFCGGAVICLCGEILARRILLPAAIFTVPGFIPLVPGVPAFSTVLLFVREDYVPGLEMLVHTALLVFALAAGIGSIYSIARIRELRLF